MNYCLVSDGNEKGDGFQDDLRLFHLIPGLNTSANNERRPKAKIRNGKSIVLKGFCKGLDVIRRYNQKGLFKGHHGHIPRVPLARHYFVVGMSIGTTNRYILVDGDQR